MGVRTGRQAEQGESLLMLGSALLAQGRERMVRTKQNMGEMGEGPEPRMPAERCYNDEKKNAAETRGKWDSRRVLRGQFVLWHIQVLIEMT